jgi:putative peptidoglycan lipid II flippase
MALNAVVAIGLAPFLGWIAPAIATTAAGWAMVVLLVIGGRRFGDVARFDARFRTRIWRICLAAAIMGATLWAAARLFDTALHTGGLRYLALTGLIVLGVVVYFGVAQVIGGVRLAEFAGALRRRRG